MSDGPQVLVVEEELHGVLLRDFLERQWPEIDRVALRNLAMEGRVQLNGDEAMPRARLKRGDVILVDLPGPLSTLRRRSQPGDAPVLQALHEADEFVVVAKPAGMPCGTGTEGKAPGAVDLVGRQRGFDEARPLFRLERDASGCFVVCRSSGDARELREAFERGECAPEFVSLVRGRLRRPEFRIDGALGPDPRRPGRVRVVDAGAKGARPAVTRVHVVEEFRGFTLVRVLPETWRGHQVRVHLAHIGHPVVADSEYGARPRLLLSEFKKNYKARRGVVEPPLLDRMFLHLERLSLPAPQGPVEVTAPLPDDLSVVLRKLRAFASH